MFSDRIIHVYNLNSEIILKAVFIFSKERLNCSHPFIILEPTTWIMTRVDRRSVSDVFFWVWNQSLCFFFGKTPQKLSVVFPKFHILSKLLNQWVSIGVFWHNFLTLVNDRGSLLQSFLGFFSACTWNLRDISCTIFRECYFQCPGVWLGGPVAHCWTVEVRLSR